jgi:creatinine amidohydrolase/Fe(II)-dependent formamide hydrolase-like protein
MLRMSKAGPGKSDDGSGVVGNPARSTVEYGKQILEMQIADATRQLRTLRESTR